MPTSNNTLPSDKERERLNPGAGPGRPNNAIGDESAALPGGSNEDVKGKRGHTAGEQAAHGTKTAEDPQRGDADRPSQSPASTKTTEG